MTVLQVERDVKSFTPDDLDFTLDSIDELNPDPVSNTDTFFSILHPPGYHRFTQDLAYDWPRSYWSRTDEALRMPPPTGKEQIFVSVNPICQRITDDDRTNPKFIGKADSWIEQRIASKIRTVAALITLIRDYDAKDFTDPSQAEIIAQYEILRANPDKAKSTDKALLNEAVGAAKSAKFKTNPDHYKALALAHVKALTPAPSVIVASGGGYNCYWLLDLPFNIRTDEHDQFNHITSYAADVQKRWVHMDPRADQGVNDIRRILRPVGTINHKPAYGPNFPVVSFVKKDFALRYSLVELVAYLPPIKTAPAKVRTVTARAATEPTETAQEVTQEAFEGDSVIFAYNAKHKIVTILEANGYTRRGDRMMRPGGDGQPGVTFDEAKHPNQSFHHSSNDPLNNGYWRSPFDVFKEYEHKGNQKKAVYFAAVELDMVYTSEQAQEEKTNQVITAAKWIQAARQWLQSADLAAIIPVELQSATGYRTLATDKRLYSAYLDIFAGYRTLSGPVSNQQLSLASGLSEGSVRNAQRRWLATGWIRKIDTPEQNENTGAFWFELVKTAEIISCVDCAVVGVVTAKLPPAKYATEIFTKHKADDAYQRGGSKRQRKQATIKAIGADGLILIDVLHDYGPMSQQQYGAIAKQSKFTISRLVRRLEEFGIVIIEKQWRARIITLVPDWQASVERLAPEMPTYGNKFRRTLNAHLNTIDNCDRQVARGMGDRTRIDKRRERAAKGAFELQAQELAEQFATDRQREAIERLRQHNGQSRAAAGMCKTVRTLPFVEQMARKEAPKWFAPYSQEDNRRLVDMMQTLADNELLAEARQQMRDEDAGIYTPPTQPTYTQQAMVSA